LGYEIEKRIKNLKGRTGIFIEDLTTGWKISFNHKEVFPAASLIKLPIMLSCFYAIKEGKLNLKENVTLKPSDKVGGSGILKNLPVGKTFTIERLLELMITVSDNTATNLLIEKLGFEYLNLCFKKIGLKNTLLLRKMMDFQARKKRKENLTTAEDMASILRRIYFKKFLNKSISQKCLQYLLHQKYRDRIPSKLPSGIKVAHKTGLERKICHDAGLVFGPKGDFLIVVLTQGERIKKAKEFIAEISSLVYKYYGHF
ncbi:MAG: serine hydrolase, partial [Candidatus Omnitrophota bacterium]